jgi:hypothetical protein
MQLEQEHGTLLAAARKAVAELDQFDGRLDPLGDVSYGQHYEFAMRARWLSYVLDAALNLLGSDAYPACFSVLRSALEHHVVDVLLFLGD